MLLQHAVGDERYTTDYASLAAEQLRLRFEMEALHTKIVQIQAQISQISSTDTAGLLELLTNLQESRTNYEEISQLVHTPTRSAT